jgi:hypothetical protein
MKDTTAFSRLVLLSCGQGNYRYVEAKFQKPDYFEGLYTPISPDFTSQGLFCGVPLKNINTKTTQKNVTTENGY